jgi:hypothetical protein
MNKIIGKDSFIRIFGAHHASNGVLNRFEMFNPKTLKCD